MDRSPAAGAERSRRRRDSLAQCRRHGGAVGGIVLRAGFRQSRRRSRMDGNAEGSGLYRNIPAPGGRTIRRLGDRGLPDRPLGLVRRARAVRRPDPRAPRRAADGTQLLFHRYPHRADAGGLDAGLAVGGTAGRTPQTGPRRLAPGDGHKLLGNVQHAHRRRRHRARISADGGPAPMGHGVAAGDGVRGHAGHGPRPAPGRCHAPGIGVFPRRLSRAHRPVRFRRPRRRGAN